TRSNAVAVFQELGENEHSHARLSSPDLKRRAEPVVGVIRRHLDISDKDVRAVDTCHADQVVSTTAVPTTSKPPSSRMCTIPSRTIGWSSPTTTRICPGGLTAPTSA